MPRRIRNEKSLRKQQNHRQYYFTSFSPSSSSQNELSVEADSSPISSPDYPQNQNIDGDSSTTRQEQIPQQSLTTSSWRKHPAINPHIDFPSWIVPEKYVHQLLNAECMQPYLASRFPLLEHLHVRFKIVMNHHDDDDDDDEGEQDSKKDATKLLLLHPDIDHDSLPFQVHQLILDCHVRPGPILPVDFHYHQFTASYILSQLFPESLQPVPTSFESVGHIAHLNGLDDHPGHWQHRHMIGEVLLATLPRTETVIHKVGNVKGDYRTYDYEILAGRPDTRVEMTEHGAHLRFDLAKVYWCSRLEHERQRLIREEILASSTKEGDENIVVADAFCGVGAMLIQLARQQKRGVTIYANDWNPDAVTALKQNAALNKVERAFERIQCGDAYDFLMDLGLQQQQQQQQSSQGTNGDGEESASVCGRLPDHVVLNFPLEAPRFLGALRWWPALSSSSSTSPSPASTTSARRRRGRPRKQLWPNDESAKHDTTTTTTSSSRSAVIIPRVHVYTFARAHPETNRSLSDVAVDLVAQHLLPVMSRTSSSSDSSGNGEEWEQQPVAGVGLGARLNEDYNANVKVHAVRDVAPSKVVMCVSFSATPKLLRHMQGDFRDDE